MSEGNFCTIFNCMDGRVQEKAFLWAKDNFNIDFADTLTLPGMDKQLAENTPESNYVTETMAKISTEGHGSKVAIVVGHTSCAGNPVTDTEHEKDIQKAVDRIASLNIFDVVAGVFVGGDEDPKNWEVKEVCRK